MIEVFKIVRGIYDINVTFNMLNFSTRRDISRGHRFKLIKQHCQSDLKKFAFKNRVVDFWNSLPAKVVEADSVATFERRLDKFWENLDMKFDFEASYPSYI